MRGASGQRPVVMWRKWYSAMAAGQWIAEHGLAFGQRLIVTEETHRRSVRVDVYPRGEAAALRLRSRFGGRVMRLKPEIWLRPQLPRRTAIRAGRLAVLATRRQAQRFQKLHRHIAVICIPTGLAFGTGQHATTKMCLRALSEAWPFDSLLDAGCGTGVLGIAAAKLGVRRVRAFDIDRIAVREARKNAISNGVRIEVRREDLGSFGAGRFDVVVGNILSAPLVAGARRVSGALKPGGLLILSGIRPNQAAEVIGAFSNCRTIARHGSDGWICLVLRKRKAVR